MAIHSTERYTNVRARLGVWFASLTITGSPRLVHDGAPRDRLDLTTGFARIMLEPLPEFHAALGATEDLYSAAVLVVVDVFWPSGEDGRSDYNAHDIEKATDDIAFSLRRLSLTFLDYSSTPLTPSTVTGARLRARGAPSVLRLPTSDSFDRRRVTAECGWLMQHAA